MKYLIVLLFVLSGCTSKETKPTIRVATDVKTMYGDKFPQNIKYNALVRLYKKGQFRCSAFIIDANYAITAGHCAEVGEQNMELYDVVDNKTNTNVSCVASDHTRDVALLQGDFDSFDFFPVDFTGENQSAMTGTPLFMCGFPAGGGDFCSQTVFNRLVAINGRFVVLVESGQLYPGMSGGPVLDMVQRKIIGVNSSVATDHIFIGSLLGLDGTFGIKRYDK